MTQEAFVNWCKDYGLAGVATTLKAMEAPTKSPTKAMLRRAGWYSKLSEADRRDLAFVLRRASMETLFSLFCILDGVASGSHGEFELTYLADGRRERINGSGFEMLHDLVNLRKY